MDDVVIAIVYDRLIREMFLFSLSNIASFISMYPDEDILFCTDHLETYLRYVRGKIRNHLLTDGELVELETLVKENHAHEIEFIRQATYEEFETEGQKAEGKVILFQQKAEGNKNCVYLHEKTIMSNGFRDSFGEIRFQLALTVIWLLMAAYGLECNGADVQDFLFNGVRFCTEHHTCKDGSPLLLFKLKGEEL